MKIRSVFPGLRLWLGVSFTKSIDYDLYLHNIYVVKSIYHRLQAELNWKQGNNYIDTMSCNVNSYDPQG